MRSETSMRNQEGLQKLLAKCTSIRTKRYKQRTAQIERSSPNIHQNSNNVVAIETSQLIIRKHFYSVLHWSWNCYFKIVHIFIHCDLTLCGKFIIKMYLSFRRWNWTFTVCIKMVIIQTTCDVLTCVWIRVLFESFPITKQFKCEATLLIIHVLVAMVNNLMYALPWLLTSTVQRVYSSSHIYGVCTACRNPNIQTPMSVKTNIHARIHTHGIHRSKTNFN